MLEHVLSRMARFPQHALVQTWACRALAALCRNQPAHYKTPAGEQGALEAAVSALHHHPQHQDVQALGCLALWSVCEDHPANQQRAGEAGAVEAVVHVLDRAVVENGDYFTWGRLNEWGYDALRILTNGHTANKTRLQASGGAHYMRQQPA